MPYFCSLFLSLCPLPFPSLYSKAFALLLKQTIASCRDISCSLVYKTKGTMGVGRTKAPLHSFPPLPLPKLLPHKPKPKQLASSISFLVGLLLACLLVRCFLSPSAPCPSLSVCFIGLGARDIGGGEEARGGCFVFLGSHVPWRQAVVPQGVSQGP